MCLCSYLMSVTCVCVCCVKERDHDQDLVPICLLVICVSQKYNIIYVFLDISWLSIINHDQFYYGSL